MSAYTDAYACKMEKVTKRFEHNIYSIIFLHVLYHKEGPFGAEYIALPKKCAMIYAQNPFPYPTLGFDNGLPFCYG